jgi:hypothetical protein
MLTYSISNALSKSHTTILVCAEPTMSMLVFNGSVKIFHVEKKTRITLMLPFFKAQIKLE